jgi:hypothetical protein
VRLENFKNIWVGLRVGLFYRVGLLKKAFKSVRLNCQVAKSLFFSRHILGCSVFLRLGTTDNLFKLYNSVVKIDEYLYVTT